MVWIICICSCFLLILYLVFIWAVRSIWSQEKNWEIPTDFNPTTSVSILIAARNESKQIKRCLEGLKNQSYPSNLYEIILIDDHSSDDTIQIARSLDLSMLTILELDEKKYGKKEALKKGQEYSTADLIVTTDADTWVDNEWLDLLVSLYEEKEVKFIAGPVIVVEDTSLITHFQALDMLGNNLVTAAGIFRRWYYSANGANLAFDSDAFRSIGAYDISKLASGDDMFTIQKLATAYPGGIFYLKNKDAAVKTDAIPGVTKLMRQRKRWATKSQAYPDHILQGVLVLVSLFTLSILVNILVGLIWSPLLLKVGLIQLFLKGLIDYSLLRSSSKYFNQPFSLNKYIGAFFIHIANVIYSSFWAIFKGQYVWKGRKVN